MRSCTLDKIMTPECSQEYFHHCSAVEIWRKGVGGGAGQHDTGHMVLGVSSPNGIKLRRFPWAQSYHCGKNCALRLDGP